MRPTGNPRERASADRSRAHSRAHLGEAVKVVFRVGVSTPLPACASPASLNQSAARRNRARKSSRGGGAGVGNHTRRVAGCFRIGRRRHVRRDPRLPADPYLTAPARVDLRGPLRVGKLYAAGDRRSAWRSPVVVSFLGSILSR